MDNSEPHFYRQVDDETYATLTSQLEGARVMGAAIWEESLADDEENRPQSALRDVFDLDLYLENHLYLELYATYLFSDPDEDPLHGLDAVGTMLSHLIERNLWLNEIAVTDDDELVLILGYHHRPQLYLNVGGWTLAEWETLPDEVGG